MNRGDMSRQVLQAGTQVNIDSKGRRTESPMPAREKSNFGAGAREFVTGMERRKKAAGMWRGGKVKKPGGRYD